MRKLAILISQLTRIVRERIDTLRRLEVVRPHRDDWQLKAPVNGAIDGGISFTGPAGARPAAEP